MFQNIASIYCYNVQSFFKHIITKQNCKVSTEKLKSILFRSIGILTEEFTAQQQEHIP